VPPRTVANSDKEKIQLLQTTNAESTNPALTPTANPRTDHPGIDPDQPQNLTPQHHPQPLTNNRPPSAAEPIP
jgi:hypothetical protein